MSVDTSGGDTGASAFNLTETLAVGGKASEGHSKLNLLKPPHKPFSTKSTREEIEDIFGRTDGTKERFKIISSGGSGALIAKSDSFTIKIQENTERVRRALIKAEKLNRECDIVEFETFVDGKFVATVMETMKGDCMNDFGLCQTGPFFSFLETLQACLKKHKITYMDMKLSNIGKTFDHEGKPVFRLIDLDALGERQYTYPLSTEAVRDKYGQDQTEYAFLVASLMAECATKKERDTLKKCFVHNQKFFTSEHERLEWLRKSQQQYRHESPFYSQAGKLASFIEAYLARPKQLQ
jgi:hypothetical protein